MSLHFELHTWRMAAAYCGQSLTEEVCEEYFFRDKKISAKVYRIPGDWIEKTSLPSGFYENSDAVGCVKTSHFNENNQMVPCVIFDMEKERTTWENYEDEMDPVLYILQEHAKYEVDRYGLVIIQSSENPWCVGLIAHCDASLVKPLPWSDEDRAMVYGLDETEVNP